VGGAAPASAWGAPSAIAVWNSCKPPRARYLGVPMKDRKKEKIKFSGTNRWRWVPLLDCLAWHRKLFFAQRSRQISTRTPPTPRTPLLDTLAPWKPNLHELSCDLNAAHAESPRDHNMYREGGYLAQAGGAGQTPLQAHSPQLLRGSLWTEGNPPSFRRRHESPDELRDDDDEHRHHQVVEGRA
jgi:hypothetical protein